MDRETINKLREAYPTVDGRSDFCVYWFRRAQDHLKVGQRAGLVGTNTIRQNYSREAGLDYVVKQGGTITNSVSSMIWSGEAVVHVSIVNWVKGPEKGKKRLYIQDGNDIETGWRHSDFDTIGPSLSFSYDVTQAKRIDANASEGECYQGQTHGHAGFLLSASEAKSLISKEKKYADVVFPFLIANNLIGTKTSKPTRYVIDFLGFDVLEAAAYPKVFDRIKARVLPARQAAAAKEKKRNKAVLEADPKAKINRHHENFLKYWWRLSYERENMISAIDNLSRYISCGQVTKRPIFEFISSKIRPNAACMVFAHDDDYSFGILQSSMHWLWFTNRCSTLKADFRYTSNSVFDTFPWPQKPSAKAVRALAESAVAFRKKRNELRAKHNLSLRELYQAMDAPGDHPLKKAQAELDAAVRKAYGASASADALEFLLELNALVAAAEENGDPVQKPGLPALINDHDAFVTDDYLEP